MMMTHYINCTSIIDSTSNNSIINGNGIKSIINLIIINTDSTSNIKTEKLIIVLLISDYI